MTKDSSVQSGIPLGRRCGPHEVVRNEPTNPNEQDEFKLSVPQVAGCEAQGKQNEHRDKQRLARGSVQDVTTSNDAHNEEPTTPLKHRSTCPVREGAFTQAHINTVDPMVGRGASASVGDQVDLVQATPQVDRVSSPSSTNAWVDLSFGAPDSISGLQRKVQDLERSRERERRQARSDEIELHTAIRDLQSRLQKLEIRMELQSNHLALLEETHHLYQ